MTNSSIFEFIHFEFNHFPQNNISKLNNKRQEFAHLQLLVDTLTTNTHATVYTYIGQRTFYILPQGTPTSTRRRIYLMVLAPGTVVCDINL